MIEQTKQIKIAGREYEISFPNVGQLLQIESMKQSLSAGQYRNMAMTPTEDTETALDLIDMYAHFSVLLPEKFKTEFLPKNFGELSLKDSLPIVKAYKEEFFPWYNSIKAELKKI